uniref:Uncharacterized protein n=1 Tax=Oryza punctata TaxID=4537 RepID=A0A0E0L7S6_ORYPU
MALAPLPTRIPFSFSLEYFRSDKAKSSKIRWGGVCFLLPARCRFVVSHHATSPGENLFQLSGNGGCRLRLARAAVPADGRTQTE